MFRKILINSIYFLIDAIRPILGPSYCCIYTITCRDYAKITLQEKSIFIAVPLIILRLISCNPITALFFKLGKH